MVTPKILKQTPSMFICSGIGRRFRKAQETDAADGLDSVIETFAYALAMILLERLGSLVGPWGPMDTRIEMRSLQGADLSQCGDHPLGQHIFGVCSGPQSPQQLAQLATSRTPFMQRLSDRLRRWAEAQASNDLQGVTIVISCDRDPGRAHRTCMQRVRNNVGMDMYGV